MHCGPDAEAAMSDIKRVLKPGGKLNDRITKSSFSVLYTFDELHLFVRDDSIGKEGGIVETEILGLVYGDAF